MQGVQMLDYKCRSQKRGGMVKHSKIAEKTRFLRRKNRGNSSGRSMPGNSLLNKRKNFYSDSAQDKQIKSKVQVDPVVVMHVHA